MLTRNLNKYHRNADSNTLENDCCYIALEKVKLNLIFKKNEEGTKRSKALVFVHVRIMQIGSKPKTVS